MTEINPGKMAHVSEFRFIQYIATFDGCQILMIPRIVIITFGYPQKLMMYRTTP